MKKHAFFALAALFLATLGILTVLRRADHPVSPPTNTAATNREAPSSVTPTIAESDTSPASGPTPSTPASVSTPASPDRSASAAQSDSRSTRSTATDSVAARFPGDATAADLLQAADLTDPAQRAYVVARLSELQEAQNEAALATAERLGIPVRIEGPGNKVSVLYDFRDGRPLYRTTFNTAAAISTGADQLRDLPAPFGLTGAGLRAGVWDEAKVRNTHQEFAGGRVAIRDSASTFSDHATHVAGTIGATGVVANARGMAPQAGIDSYDWNNDYAEMTAAGAASATDTARLPLSNHSYGFDATTADMGRYETEARTLDALAAALPFYSVFWAAGNEQDLLTALGGYQSITFTGLAKNIITIGAGADAVSGGQRAPSVGTIATFSSLGPSDDGRIKPDLTANGVDLYSPACAPARSRPCSSTPPTTWAAPAPTTNTAGATSTSAPPPTSSSPTRPASPAPSSSRTP
ncbi:MAG: S8 family serine peptidase [Opitutaceae bacterium]|nr:S8 family serine peptidase [Opitutaceae bacterium]